MGETIDLTPSVSDGRWTSTMPKVERAVDEAQRLTFAINAILETLKSVQDISACNLLLDSLKSLIYTRDWIIEDRRKATADPQE